MSKAEVLAAVAIVFFAFAFVFSLPVLSATNTSAFNFSGRPRIVSVNCAQIPNTLSVFCQAQVAGGSPPYDFQWTAGGVYDTGQNPTFTFNATRPEALLGQLKVTDSTGAVSYASLDIIIGIPTTTITTTQTATTATITITGPYTTQTSTVTLTQQQNFTTTSTESSSSPISIGLNAIFASVGTIFTVLAIAVRKD